LNEIKSKVLQGIFEFNLGKLIKTKVEEEIKSSKEAETIDQLVKEKKKMDLN